MDEEPRRLTTVPHPDPVEAKKGVMIAVEYVDFILVKEDWSIWELEDGTRIRAKLGLSEVHLPYKQELKAIFLTPDGRPKYGVSFNVNVVIETSENVIVKTGN